MTLLVVGLSYRSAPVEIRERLALANVALNSTLERLVEEDGPLSEAVILSTCNRLEVYAVAGQANEGIDWIERSLYEGRIGSPSDIRPYLYIRKGDAAAEHLMRVACGLDSMIIGESQILGQITGACEAAQREGTCGAVMSHLFSRPIHAGKRAHTETSIGRYFTSVSHSGVALMMQALQKHPERVLIVGAGEMAGLAAQALQRQGDTQLRFISRTYPRALTLAEAYGGSALHWNDLHECLGWADAVLCATNAPHIVLRRSDVVAATTVRGDRPLVIVDIAVPRDVDATVRELPGVRYYDIDDLQAVLDSNLVRRKAAIPAVEAIIESEMAAFMEWYRGREVTPVIRDLRDWAQTVATEELEETLGHLPDADERTRQVVGRLAHRLVNRLLHEPTTRLRLQAAEGYASGYSYAVRELFALWDVNESPDESYAPECQCARESGESAAHCDLKCLVAGHEHQSV